MVQILIFTVGIGAGHDRTAAAIKEELERQHAGVQVTVVDALKYINPFVDKVVVEGYLATIKTIPELYGYIFRKAEKDGAAPELRALIANLLSYKFAKLLEKVEPSAIVCTHPLPLEMLGILREKGRMDIPVIAVVTDYGVHPFWVHDFVNAIVVAADTLVEEVTAHGFPRERVYPLGLPLSPAFSADYDRDRLRAGYGLDQRPAILLMGGGLGLGAVAPLLQEIAASDLDVQVIAVAGRNKRLFRELKTIAESSDKNIRVFSFTSKVAELMRACDLIISKPGGLTVTEAIASKLPIAIISPLAGHEQYNVDFLVNTGLAIWIRNEDKAVATLKQFFANPLRSQQIRQMAAHMARPGATREIAGLVLNLAEEKQKKVGTLAGKRPLVEN